MNCDNEAIAWVEERGCLLPKTKPVKIPPTPPRISEQINLDPDFCLSWNTSSTGANDLVRSNVKKAPAKVRTREAKKRDKAYGKRKPFVGRRSVNRIVAIRVLPSTESPEVGGQKVTRGCGKSRSTHLWHHFLLSRGKNTRLGGRQTRNGCPHKVTIRRTHITETNCPLLRVRLGLPVFTQAGTQLLC